MIEVTKEQFYASLKNLDVVVTVTGSFPYTLYFKKRCGTIFGKIVGKTWKENTYHIEGTDNEH